MDTNKPLTKSGPIPTTFLAGHLLVGLLLYLLLHFHQHTHQPLTPLNHPIPSSKHASLLNQSIIPTINPIIIIIIISLLYGVHATQLHTIGPSIHAQSNQFISSVSPPRRGDGSVGSTGSSSAPSRTSSTSRPRCRAPGSRSTTTHRKNPPPCP